MGFWDFSTGFQICSCFQGVILEPTKTLPQGAKLNLTRFMAAVAVSSVIAAASVAYVKYGKDEKPTSPMTATRLGPSYCATIFDALSELRCQVRIDFRSSGFDPRQSSRMLADFRMEGKYPICAANSQIPSERYIDLAQALQALDSKGLPQDVLERVAMASNTFVGQPTGMSDCDWRVMEQIFAMYGIDT